MSQWRNPVVLRAIPFFVTLCLLTIPAQAKYSGGTGEPNDPYQIATAADLIALGNEPNDYDKHFLLTADIDLDPDLPGRKVFDQAVIGMRSVPWRSPNIYRTVVCPFTGVFDGNDHTISHLTITGAEYLGLFSQLESGAVVTRLGVTDANVSGSYDNMNPCAGALAADSNGVIAHCYCSGHVRGFGSVGGLVARNRGTMTECYGVATVDGSRGDVGGLVGTNSGTIDQCYHAGLVGTGRSVGGLAGYSSGSISRSYNTGVVRSGSTGSYFVGGVVGDSGGTLDLCYNSGSVMGGPGYAVTGGVAGTNSGRVEECHNDGMVNGAAGLIAYNSGTVVHCYNTGAIYADYESAGLIGRNTGRVFQCYNTGTVVGEKAVSSLLSYNDSGGIVIQCYSTGEIKGYASALIGGYGTGTVVQCYGVNPAVPSGLWTFGGGKDSGPACWLCDVRTAYGVYWGRPRTSVQMRDMRTYQDAGWDFVDGNDGTSDVWQMVEGVDYPVLAFFQGYAQPTLQGKGTPDDPYLISNAAELGAIAHNDPFASYRLVASIDLSGIRWGESAIPCFGGSFDGNGQTISHLTLQGLSHLGLFGSVTSGGKVRNLGIADVNAIGVYYDASQYTVSGHESCLTATPSSYVSALVGENCGSLAGCYSTGKVNGHWYVGGLVGENWGSITDCYSKSTTTGTRWVGGLAAETGGLTSRCYATGAVNSVSDGGGLAASSCCYSCAATACFWDTQTSGQAKSIGGTGKTTAQMQTAETFTDAGWDFVGETDNGTDDIWWIEEGKDYPRLWWEAPFGVPPLGGLEL